MKTLPVLLIASVAWAATPAQTAIESAKSEIAKHSDYAPNYSALAKAYVKRADETADPQYYAQAEEAVERAFQLSPDLYDGKRAEVLIHLGRHEYARALELATALNKKTPDDVAVYGYLVDTDVALGNYKDAVTAAQWMLDLRPGNIPGLSHAAMLSELHGNLAGALELLQMAYGSMPTAATGDRASMLTRMAHVHLLLGDLARAEESAKQALAVFPDYYAALAELAHIRLAQKQYDEAVTLWNKLCTAVPRGKYLYARAEALELAGWSDEGAKAFVEFERKAMAETDVADNSNHELATYYVDHAHQPGKALEVARREAERRKDVFTLDCYAWALAANGQYDAASTQMKQALRIPVKDPKILAHSEFIADHLGQTSKNRDAPAQ
jgi:tetratricopeptide (TPR) repeat protein